MDCNKVESYRAKDIAEKKMESYDFFGAQKFLLKALHLFPDIENASHMLTVCEVHCSAGSLANGQTDHYGVLKVEPLAEESLIRKQYRRLALLLHPDKNRFVGAEAAFKLVGEAYRVLSDQSSRQLYDLKRKQMRSMSSWRPSQNYKDAKIYNGASNNQFGYQQPSSAFFASQYFWTICICCRNRFQLSKTFLNFQLQCPKCFKHFYAIEVSLQNIPTHGSSPEFPCSTGFPQTDVHKSQKHFEKPSGTRVHEHVPRHPIASKSSIPATAAKQGFASLNKEEMINPVGNVIVGNQLKSENVKCDGKPAEKPSSGNACRSKSRKGVVSSSDSDSFSAMGIPTVLNDGTTNSQHPRRSTRDNINVTYKEDVSEEEDDDFVCPPKRLRKSGSYNTKNQKISSTRVVANGFKIKTTCTLISEDKIKVVLTGDDPCEDNLPRGGSQESGIMPESKEAVGKKVEQAGSSSNANSSFKSSSRTQEVGSCISYPDPEFYDFDIDRCQRKFRVNQIWAVYDDDDAMPRYYAMIQKVFCPGFKLQYIWLEYNPMITAEKAWSNAGLPTACGNFKHGKVHITKSQQLFSHLICCEKVRKNSYNIYPKMGEVWALFKDWDMGWSSAEGGPKEYAYEFAEVVSDFEYGQDFNVSHLVKVKGFRYLFAPAHDKGITVVPPGQLLKFSHRVPCHKVCGEREGIPRDSMELDPAALPQSFVKMTDPVSADT